MIREFWIRLEKKQRYYVAGAVIFIALVLILEFGVFSSVRRQRKNQAQRADEQEKIK